MKKKGIYIGTGIVCLLLLLFGTYKLMNARTFQLFGNLTYEVETNEKVVALSFDDGPTKQVNDILPLLDKYDAKGTFFLIGKDIEQHPEEVKKIVAAGHQVGNHTYSHPRMVFKTLSTIREEIEKTDELIRAAGYEDEIDFRPPNGKQLVLLPYYLLKYRRDTVTWNLEPDSFYTSPADKIRYVKEHVTPGSIILMHPMYDDTGKELEAIEGILRSLTDKGYTFVTVDELQSLACRSEN